MRTIVLTLAVCLAAATLPAAEPPPVTIGARVRARGSDGLGVEGTLAALGADDITILVAQGNQATSIRLDRIERLQFVDGRDRGAGFFWGLIAGIGVAVGVHLSKGFQICNTNISDDACENYGGAIGLLTVPLGALLGTVAAPQRWRDVELPAPARPSARGLRFQVAPVRGGARFALGYAF